MCGVFFLQAFVGGVRRSGGIAAAALFAQIAAERA
jgi:hypothetical protein